MTYWTKFDWYNIEMQHILFSQKKEFTLSIEKYNSTFKNHTMFTCYLFYVFWCFPPNSISFIYPPTPFKLFFFFKKVPKKSENLIGSPHIKTLTYRIGILKFQHINKSQDDNQHPNDHLSYIITQQRSSSTWSMWNNTLTKRKTDHKKGAKKIVQTK